MKKLVVTFVVVTACSIVCGVFFALWPLKSHLEDLHSWQRLQKIYRIQSSNLDICLLTEIFCLFMIAIVGAGLYARHRGRVSAIPQLTAKIAVPFYQVLATSQFEHAKIYASTSNLLTIQLTLLQTPMP